MGFEDKMNYFIISCFLMLVLCKVADLTCIPNYSYYRVDTKAEVTYPGGGVECGNILSLYITQEPPTAVTWPARKGAYYTLIMIDPDAPSHSNPVQAEWLHWLVCNINGNDINTGDVIVEYNGPTPPRGSGLHRYIILVYKQINKLNSSDSGMPTHRSKFDVHNFAAKYDLGSPVAGNYFKAERH